MSESKPNLEPSNKSVVPAKTESKIKAAKPYDNEHEDDESQSCLTRKVLKARLVQIEFESEIENLFSYKYQKPIAKPHWKEGLDINEGQYSERPHVYLKQKSANRTVKLNVLIEQSINIIGKGLIRGKLSNIIIEGECPTEAGTHCVTAKIISIHDHLSWTFGDASWQLNVPDSEIELSLTTTRLELFFIFNQPKKMFNANGVWIEALRFVCGNMNAQRTTTSAKTLERITEYCHHEHNLTYDTVGGAPSYGVSSFGGRFNLASYMKRGSRYANCYDQAGAIQTFAGAVGIEVEWLYLKPFGFIKETDLLGIGRCNNPFFGRDYSKRILPADDPERKAFGNHAFCGYLGNALDACAGPHVGDEDLPQYLNSSIDGTSPFYGKNNRPGTLELIRTKRGVTSVI